MYMRAVHIHAYTCIYMRAAHIRAMYMQRFDATPFTFTRSDQIPLGPPSTIAVLLLWLRLRLRSNLRLGVGVGFTSISSNRRDSQTRRVHRRVVHARQTHW